MLLAILLASAAREMLAAENHSPVKRIRLGVLRAANLDESSADHLVMVGTEYLKAQIENAVQEKEKE